MPTARGHRARAVELALRQRGRDGGDGERALAQRARGQRGHERRVDAAGEGDDRREPSPRDPRSRASSLQRRHARRLPRWAAASARAQTVLTGAPVRLRAARAVVVLGRDVDDAAVRGGRPSRAPARPPTSTVRQLALELPAVAGARCARRACSSRAASPRATALLVVRPGERGEHEARAAVLHLRRRDPDVERAGGEAAPPRRRARARARGRRGWSRSATTSCARPRPSAASPTITRTTFGQLARGRACRRRSRARSSRIGRQRPELARQRGDERGAGRRDQLGLEVDAVAAARLAAARASAGAGSGSVPCAACAKPRPSGSGEQTISSMPRLSSASATPQTSPIASTRADLVEVHLLGPRCRGRGPRRRRAARTPPARARVARAGSPWPRRSARGRRAQSRWRLLRRDTDAHARAPRSSGGSTPPRLEVEARTPRPREPGAHRALVGAGVEQRAEQHVAGDAGRRSRRRGAGSSRAARGAGDARRDRAGAEAVVDVHDRHARRAGGEHRQQRRHAAERRAVAGAGRARRSPARRRARRPPRRAPRPGRRRRPRSRRARRSSSAGASRCRPATPASSWTTTAVPSSSARTRASCTTGPSDVPPDTIVTRPQAAGTSRATHASRARASSSASGATRAQRRTRLGVGARHQHAARAAVEQRARDRLDLLGRLALREDRLGRALAQLAVRCPRARSRDRRRAGCPIARRRRLAVVSPLSTEASSSRIRACRPPEALTGQRYRESTVDSPQSTETAEPQGCRLSTVDSV